MQFLGLYIIGGFCVAMAIAIPLVNHIYFRDEDEG